jgi:hypothetical protein
MLIYHDLHQNWTAEERVSIHDRPPLVASTVAETSIGLSNGPPSIPQTPTKGAALLSRIGSVKKWGVKRRRGDSTAPTDANGMYDKTCFYLTNTLLQFRLFRRVRARL